MLVNGCSFACQKGLETSIANVRPEGVMQIYDHYYAKKAAKIWQEVPRWKERLACEPHLVRCIIKEWVKGVDLTRFMGRASHFGLPTVEWRLLVPLGMALVQVELCFVEKMQPSLRLSPRGVYEGHH